MASIRKHIQIEAPPDKVWDALRDVGALHTRLVPGFVTDTRMEENARVVTFGNGMVAREEIVSVDDGAAPGLLGHPRCAVPALQRRGVGGAGHQRRHAFRLDRGPAARRTGRAGRMNDERRNRGDEEDPRTRGSGSVSGNPKTT